MFKIITIVVFFISVSAKGQIYLSDPLSGKPYPTGAYNDIRGSAYLFDDWKMSNVTDNHGVTFRRVKIRFDAYDNKFYYTHGDTTYSFVTPLTEIDLFPFTGDTTTKMVFKKGFAVSGKLTPDKFVQVLTEGKIKVIKYIYKTQEETTEYNVPGKIKSFGDRMVYFFIKDAIVLSQKPNSKLLEELLKDKWTVVEPFMKQHSLSPKNEEDCIRAINYYNTL